MSLTRTVARNTVIQIVGRVVTTMLSLVVVGTLTRYLGVAGYGQYTTIFAYGAFLGVLADSGFFWIMLRELSQDDADVDAIASNVLTLRSLLGVAVFVLGALVSFAIPQYSAIIRTGIVIISFAWFWTTINQTFVGIFQARHRMDQAVISDIVGRTVILLGVLWLSTHGGSLLSILGAYAAGNSVNFIVSLLLGRSFARIRPQFDTDFWRKIALEAWPMGVVIILGSIYFKIDTVMLSLLKSSTEVGIYGAPYKILEVLLTIPTIFLGNIFPVLTRYLTTNDERLARVFQRAFDVLLMIAVPMVVGASILASPILRFVAGQAYVTTSTITLFGQPATGVLALQILLVAVGISFFTNLFNYVLVADGRQRELIWPNVLFVVVNIGANLIAIPVLSYIGSALTTVLTEIVVVTVLGWLVYRDTGLRLYAAQSGRIVLAGIGMGCLVWLGRDLPLLASLLIGAISYPLLLGLTGAVTTELVQSLRGGSVTESR